MTKVGRVAAELHGDETFVRECPQESVPGLAGRRMFQVKYGDGSEIEKDDIEVIRRNLERGLKYGYRPYFLLSLLPRPILTGICISAKAWSATFDDNGRITWYPEHIGLDAIRG